jgi:hypothetical protein
MINIIEGCAAPPGQSTLNTALHSKSKTIKRDFALVCMTFTMRLEM